MSAFLPLPPLPKSARHRPTATRPPICTIHNPSPLSNTRILLTTPYPYLPRLLPLFPPHTSRPIPLPTISTTPLPASDLHQTLLTLPTHNVLAFTSRTAIAAFASHLASLPTENAHPHDSLHLLRMCATRIAALGADASAVKQFLGVTPDILPLTPSPDGLVDFLAADDSLANATVLCPVPRVVAMEQPPVVPNFLRRLREEGFAVTEVPLYETRPTERALLQFELDALLNTSVHSEQPVFHAIAFTSSGEAYALAAMLEEDERNAFAALVQKGTLVVAAHGPYTAEGVRYALGVDDVVVSQDFGSFEGMVTALEQEFARRHREQGRLLLPT